MRRHRKKIVLLAVVLSVPMALAAYYVDRQENLPDVMLLPSGPLQGREGGFVDRLIPENWIGVHKFWARLRGPPKLVEVHWKVFKTPDTLDSLMKANSLGPPLLSTNGHAFWIVSDRKLKIPSEDTSIPWDRYWFTGKVWTNNCDFTGYDRKISGMGSDGIVMENWLMFPRLGDSKIDLSTFVRLQRVYWPPMIPKDLSLSVRAQLPFGKSLLYIEDEKPESAAGRWVVLISANLDTNVPVSLRPSGSTTMVLP